MPGSIGGIFISYRRGDTQHVAGRLADHVGQRLDDVRIFMDVDSIKPGMDFSAAIDAAVGNCSVLLALIGPGWLTVVDDRGARRLDDPKDYVALEIGAALDRDVFVIPVLADGATMPMEDELPGALRSLAHRNAVRVDHESFRSDVAQLVQVLTEITSQPPPQQPSQPQPAPAPAASGSWAAAIIHRSNISPGELLLVDDTLRWVPGGQFDTRSLPRVRRASRIVPHDPISFHLGIVDRFEAGFFDGEVTLTTTGHDRYEFAIAGSPDAVLAAVAGRLAELERAATAIAAGAPAQQRAAPATPAQRAAWLDAMRPLLPQYTVDRKLRREPEPVVQLLADGRTDDALRMLAYGNRLGLQVLYNLVWRTWESVPVELRGPEPVTGWREGRGPTYEVAAGQAVAPLGVPASAAEILELEEPYTGLFNRPKGEHRVWARVRRES